MQIKLSEYSPPATAGQTQSPQGTCLKIGVELLAKCQRLVAGVHADNSQAPQYLELLQSHLTPIVVQQCLQHHECKKNRRKAVGRESCMWKRRCLCSVVPL